MTDSKPQRVDPSVKVSELELKGEPRGSVPLSRTLAKPEAYTPAKEGPK